MSSEKTDDNFGKELIGVYLFPAAGSLSMSEERSDFENEDWDIEEWDDDCDDFDEDW